PLEPVSMSPSAWKLRGLSKSTYRITISGSYFSGKPMTCENKNGQSTVPCEQAPEDGTSPLSRGPGTTGRPSTNKGSRTSGVTGPPLGAPPVTGLSTRKMAQSNLGSLEATLPANGRSTSTQS